MANPTGISSIDTIPAYMVPFLYPSRNGILSSLISLVYLFCTGSLFFDVVHHMLHRCNKSSHPLFQRLARMHRFHHLYFTRHMDFDEKYRKQNNFQALPLELALQICGTALGYIFATLLVPVGLVRIPRSYLWSIIVIQVLRTLVVIITSGHDSNHLIYKTAPKDLNWIFVGPEFHCLHHVYPDRYIGSFVKLFDWIWGTAYSFRGKRFLITENGPFGEAMVTELEREGVQNIRRLKFGADWDHHHFDKAAEALINCDILILAHNTKGEDAKSNCDSAVRLVQLFKEQRTTKNNPTLPEVWYVGSETDSHQTSNSNVRFLKHARSYYDDPDILYRHVVASGFQSSMGSATPSAAWEARRSMWWIRRGARYIPVSYTAFLNYFKFMYLVPYAGDVDRT